MSKWMMQTANAGDVMNVMMFQRSDAFESPCGTPSGHFEGAQSLLKCFSIPCRHIEEASLRLCKAPRVKKIVLIPLATPMKPVDDEI